MDDQQNDQEPQADEAAEQPQAGPEPSAQASAGEGQAPPPPGTGGPGQPPPLPPELQAANASKDERTWAMLCHLLALAGFFFPFGNILGPLIMWLVKRETSRFVDFHGRQSLWFQVWVSIVATVLGVISIPLMSVCVGILTALLAMVVGLGAVIYAIVGAVQVSGGKDFEYLWVGPWVRRSMP
jgi:uncharacterized Tic20 family protein